MTFTSFISFLLISYLVQTKGRNDSTCPKSFSCGNLTDLSFPFSLSTQPDCGIMFLSGCDTKPFPRIQLFPEGDWYYALGNPFNYTVELGDPKLHAELMQHKCQAFNKNFSLPNSYFFLPNSPSISFEIVPMNFVNFFKCNSTSKSTPNITQKNNDHFAGYKMYNGCKGFSIYYKLPGDDDDEDVRAGNLPANCSLIRLPIRSISDDVGLFNMLSPAFLVEYKLSEGCYRCHYGRGQCRTDIANKFHCTYPNNPQAQGHQENNPHAQDAITTRRKFGLTLGAGS
uniref:Receptor kinase n=1 Tax=Solanum tuberosum TaxID=4113 RepID=M1B3R0_SOLTU